nr:uncharacterized protein LOC111419854 [Onthophagus taurus]
MVVIILLFATINIVVATEPFYWRLYNGTIPNDAVSSEVSNLFVSRVGRCVDRNSVTFYPATLDSITKSATANIMGKKRIITDINNIMILCTSEPERLRWEYVNIQAVKGDLLKKLVPAGYLDNIERYVGKVFHENSWKITTLYQHGHKWEGLNIWKDNGDTTSVYDFQILIWS